MNRATVLCLLLVLSAAPPAAAQQSDDDDEERWPLFTRRIVVSAKRVADEGIDLDRVPANVTVITREEIERSGAATLQELLAHYAGVVLYDNVGNGIESTVDLRGFGDGTAAAVYVDGVRINEPDDNRVNLEMIDLGAIERIEIIPGGAGSSHGNGALSGTVKIYTRRGGPEPANELAAGYGGFGTTRAGVRSSGSVGEHGYFFSYGFADSDGFRDNGGYRQHHLAANYSIDSPRNYRFEAGYRYYSGELGNPGALTPAELAADREQNPFNSVDFNRSHESVFDMRYTQYFTDDAFLSAVGYRRDADIEVLTTGRHADLFGGFRSQSGHGSIGIAAQVNYHSRSEAFGPTVSIGFEVSRDSFDNVGSFTDPDGAPTFAASDRSTEQRSRAFYAHGSLTMGGLLTASAGVRHDRVDMDFSDNLGGTGDAREFSEATGSVGLAARLAPGTSLYLRYSQAFQTPTVNDLFAFPLFGSNPNLVPVTGDTYEGGLRAALGDRVLLQAAFFRMDLENEVVFVITDPLRFLGRNENVGESRRTGLELQASGSPVRGLDLLFSYTYTRAENLSLARELGVGELMLPLVPEQRLAARAAYRIGPISFGGGLLRVGEQVMSSDNANAGPMLETYTLVDLRCAWVAGYWTLRLELRNALDEQYATRGFYSLGQTYLTPAPGRSLFGALELRY